MLSIRFKLFGLGSKHKNHTLFLGVLIGVLLSIRGPAPASVTFSDGTFLNANWSATKVIDTTDGQAATFSAGQVASGGNPGAYRQTTLNWYYDGVYAGFSQGIWVAELDDNAIYNPSVSGAISSLSFSMDGLLVGTNNEAGVGESLLAFQNGTYYLGPSSYFPMSPGAWVTDASSGLGSGAFTALSGSSHPDFSGVGGPIEFGYVAATDGAAGGALQCYNTVGTDNWSVTVIVQ
ncbi:MAG: hypothetical protein ABSB42_12100 [Tepidisphaeraceae bacterium]